MLLWWRFSSLICSSFSDFSLQLLLLQLYIPLTPFSFLPLSRNRPSAHGTIHRVSLLIVWNMAGIFQATSEDLWRGSIYGSWGTALVLVFIAICHLFCSKKNVCSLLSRFQSSSVAADRHISNISNISPSCERPPQLRWISLSFLFWLLSIIIYQFLYCLDDCILLNMFSLSVGLLESLICSSFSCSTFLWLGFTGEFFLWEKKPGLKMSFILQENRDLMTNSIFFGALNTLEDLTEKLGREKGLAWKLIGILWSPHPWDRSVFIFIYFLNMKWSWKRLMLKYTSSMREKRNNKK